jgi:two-component system, sensor histidine kinase and response regulator
MNPMVFGGVQYSRCASSDPQPTSCANSSGQAIWEKAEALQRLGGDEDLLRELCQIFLEESPKHLQKLREAIADADAEATMRAAHNLKGELGYLGAAGAMQAAQELEDMGHQQTLSRAAEVFTLLERELSNLHIALRNSDGARL